jgi:hypothetical protein
VAIYPLGNGSPKERTVLGTHEDVEERNHSSLNDQFLAEASAIRAEKS